LRVASYPSQIELPEIRSDSPWTVSALRARISAWDSLPAKQTVEFLIIAFPVSVTASGYHGGLKKHFIRGSGAGNIVAI
jgi:hypothetical protein